MAKTFGDLKAGIANWLRESVEDALLNDAANDAISHLWYKLILVNMSLFLKGPITSLNITSGTERANLISIPDPTVAPYAMRAVSPNDHGLRYQDWAYTYVTESGSETKLSPVLANEEFTQFQLAMFDPTYTLGPVGVTVDPTGLAIGWNIYARPTPYEPGLNQPIFGITNDFVKQNDAPLRFTDIFQVGEGDIIIDPDAPRYSDVNTTADDILQVSLMEIQLQDGTWHRWEGGELAGFLFQRMATQVAYASTTQKYAWDVINNRTIEIRPAAGLDLNPRYFYIQKPRRIAFDAAPLPFTSFDAEPFLRFKSLAQIKLALEEFQAAALWEGKAKEQEILLQQASNTQNKPRTNTIRPFLR